VPVPPPLNRPQPPPLKCRKLATKRAPAIAPSVRSSFFAGHGAWRFNQYLPPSQMTNDVNSAPTTAPPTTARTRMPKKPRFSSPFAARITARLL